MTAAVVNWVFTVSQKLTRFFLTFYVAHCLRLCSQLSDDFSLLALYLMLLTPLHLEILTTISSYLFPLLVTFER